MKPNHGGKYQYCLSILNALSKRNDIIIVSYNLEWKKEISSNFQFIKIKKDILFLRILKFLLRINRFGLFIIRKYGYLLFNFNKLMLKLNPSKIIFSGGENISYETNFYSICPVFDIMHKYENFPELKGGLIYFFRNIHYKNVLKYCDVILVDSDLGKKQLIESYSPKKEYEKKIFKLYYTYPRYVDDFKDEKKDLKYQNYMFYPAQFWKHKNHINLLRAFKNINNEIDDMKLIFVGTEKNYIKKVENEISKLKLQNSVKIIGYVSNKKIVSLYQNAFCLVMPSFLGPTNIPQIESIALNCPVLLSDVYAHREQLEDAALYFNPRDVNDISSSILKLKKDRELRTNLVKKGEKLLKKINHESFSKNLNRILISEVSG